MHFKDLSDPKVKESQCDVGDGKLPIPALLKQLRKMGYQGGLNLEYEINAKDPLPGMQRSFSYVRGVLAGLTA
jgi:sugar phosphate isomerase/epimerase